MLELRNARKALHTAYGELERAWDSTMDHGTLMEIARARDAVEEAQRHLNLAITRRQERIEESNYAKSTN